MNNLPREEIIARVCHEANRAWCKANGDDTQLPWNKAAPWQRESAISGVQFALANPDAPPSAQHEAWRKDKIVAGWKFGEVKDADKKEHPCLLPFEELPSVQKYKDHLFRAIVQSLS